MAELDISLRKIRAEIKKSQNYNTYLAEMEEYVPTTWTDEQVSRRIAQMRKLCLEQVNAQIAEEFPAK